MTDPMALPMMQLLLDVSVIMASFSTLRFLFPSLVNGSLGWSFHNPLTSFPTIEQLSAQDRAQEVYQSLVDGFFQDSGVWVLVFDEDLRLRGLSYQAKAMLPEISSRPIGARVTDVLPQHQASAALECWQDKVNTGFPGGQSVLLRDKAGEYYGIVLFLIPAEKESGDIEAPELLADIGRYKQLASVGMHSAGMAHEIKNPLVALKTFAELLPTRYDDPEFRNTFSKLALHQICRIDGIVNDLLDYAKPKKPVLLPGKLLPLLHEAVEILGAQLQEKKVRLERLDVMEIPDVLIDAEQMRRVFLNIVLNALEAMPDGGVLTVTSAHQVSRSADGNVEICIADTGPGISEQDMEHIFEPFYTTKKKGSGLGLAISKRIVEDHGGQLRFTRRAVGTLCIIELPCWQEQPSRSVERRWKQKQVAN